MGRRIAGATALLWCGRFVRDPVSTASDVVSRHGSLVRIEPPVSTIRRLAPKIPRTILIAVGARHNQAILGQPELWRTVNITAAGKKGHVSRRLGRGLVQMNGPDQRYYRRVLMPPLRKSRLEARGEQIMDIADREISGWPSGAEFDLWSQSQELMQHLAIDLLFGADRDIACPVANRITRGLSISMSLGAALRIDLPGTPYRQFLREAEGIAEAISRWASSKRGNHDPNDLLALLVNSPTSSGKPPDDGVFINQVPTLFGAAYETCQNALVWTLVLLALHPDKQKTLIDEIRSNIGGAPISYASISRLPYLNAVVSESFRILPPVPLQYRVALDEAEVGGITVPAGTRAVLSPFVTNRDPAVYEEPRRFRPERWLNWHTKAYEMATFSGGPRVCPGGWFASSVIKTAIARLLKDQAVVVPGGSHIDYRVRVTMSPAGRVPVMLSREPASKQPRIRGRLAKALELSKT